MDATFGKGLLEEVEIVTFAGDLALLPAGLLFSFALWKRRKRVAREFAPSWKLIFVATLVMNFGFLLNVLDHAPEQSPFHFLGPSPLSSVLQYTAYLLAIGLFFQGVRQWYPLILSVQQDAIAQASLYRKLVQEANSVFLRWSRDGRILSINPYGERLFGYSEAELRGKPVIGTLLREKDARGQDMKALIAEIRRNPDEFRHNENENVTRDGRILWMAWRNTYIEAGLDGRPELLSIGVDITDRKRVEDALRVLASATDSTAGTESAMEETVRHLAQAYNVKYAFYSVYANQEKNRMKVGALWNGERISSGMEYDLLDTPCADVLAGKVELIPSGVIERYPRDQVLREWGIESYFGVRLLDDRNRVIGVIAIMDDRPMELPLWNRYLLRVFGKRIGGELQRRRAEENIYQLAHYDSLTGLPNRLLFHDRLEQALVHAQRNNQYVALLFIDLDRFKHVNDTLGHAGGDMLLREVAQRLTMLLRRSDTLARLGGDEFTILMTDFGTEEEVVRIATEVSQRVIEVLDCPFHIDDADMFISASIGITLSPMDGVNLDYLVRNADLAMYKAKERGRNRFEFYRPQLNEIAERRSRLETELRVALKNRELELHYQPLVDVDRQAIVGFEALLRWRHPRKGIVLPEDFVPIAEENGLILPIGEWVIATACRQLQELAGMGFEGLQLSLNLSLGQLDRGNLLQVLEAHRIECGLEARQLLLEITETTYLEHPETTLPVLRELREHGYPMAMDDFGTGYSSFGQLRQMPVRTLKIDRSFVSGLEEDEDKAHIVSAMIGMGRDLGLEVIAEGVETAAQASFLHGRGCRLMQGNHFSRPLEAQACAGFLAAAPAWQDSHPAL